MTPAIAEKLDIIDELYPPDRLEASKRRIAAVWRRETPDRLPFTFAPATYGAYDDLHTPEQRVHAALDDLVLKGPFGDDTIPAIFPGCRQSAMPSLFGAREIVIGNDCTCEKIIRRPEDIDGLRWELAPHTTAWNWLEFQKRVIDLTGGRLPVHVVDMQGPFDACAQLWGYDALVLCAFEEPERYHRLMGMMTDAFCAFWEEQQAVCGELFIGTHLLGWSWLPPAGLATVSMDALVMLGPVFFEEFVSPYFHRIAARLGKVVVHSCGDFAQMIPHLLEQEDIAGVNPGQMDVPRLLDCGVDGRKTLVLAAAENDAAEALRLCRRHGLHADMTVWPVTLAALAGATGEQAERLRREARLLSETLTHAASS